MVWNFLVLFLLPVIGMLLSLVALIAIDGFLYVFSQRL
jgi:hypothetical protein